MLQELVMAGRPSNQQRDSCRIQADLFEQQGSFTQRLCYQLNCNDKIIAIHIIFLI